MSKLRIEFQSAIFFQVGVVEQCLLLVSRATSSSPPSQNPPKNRKLRRQQRIGDYPISLLFCVSRGRIMPRLVDWCWFIFLWRNWFRAAKNRRGVQIRQQEASTSLDYYLVELGQHFGEITSTDFGLKISTLGRRTKRGIGARSLGAIEVPIPIGEQWPVQ